MGLRMTTEWIKSTGNRYSRHPRGAPEMNERLLNPISDPELDRRWTAVRKAMADHGVDALIVQSNNDWLGGRPPTAIRRPWCFMPMIG
jgi:hypothetical protein